MTGMAQGANGRSEIASYRDARPRASAGAAAQPKASSTIRRGMTWRCDLGTASD